MTSHTGPLHELVTMEIQLQKVLRRIKLHREVKFLNNSVIYKNVELKLSTDTYSGLLISESNINHISHEVFWITHTLGGGGGGQILLVPFKSVISKDMDLKFGMLKLFIVFSKL